MQVLDDVAGGIVEQTHGSLFKWFLDSWPQCWTAHEKLQTTRVSPRYGTILNGLICQIGPSGRYTNKAGQCKFTGTAGLKQSASRS